ncbi:MAG: hypothetical protein LH647_22070 [Leptolyngbyaceae cyanobacterium CAN_BIN12]|nr:hypothetical protein [Leptolyngbyaceae cyanobacterium CAN_BIN12]
MPLPPWYLAYPHRPNRQRVQLLSLTGCLIDSLCMDGDTYDCNDAAGGEWRSPKPKY